MAKLNDFTPEQREIIESHIIPAIALLAQAADRLGLVLSGFIYGGGVEHPVLIHATNDSVDDDFVERMSALAEVVTRMNGTKHYDTRKINPLAPQAEAFEKADKLALSLLSAPLDGDLSYIKEALDEYLASRTPKGGTDGPDQV